jgi:4-hydroxy-L-threonine phosphate dehydrogenase PdxA
MEKLKIGISVGDINGIGLEVILKTVFKLISLLPTFGQPPRQKQAR